VTSDERANRQDIREGIQEGLFIIVAFAVLILWAWIA
jgi:hypothetical protein